MVLAVFPALEEELRGDDGLPHAQMETFARLMQQAKGAADWDVYAPAARLVDELWEDADDALRNVLNVSLLERFDFQGPRGPRAWSLLSPQLQRSWRDMAAYNAWFRAGAKGPPPKAG